MTRPPQAGRLPPLREGRWALSLTTTIALCLCARPLQAQAEAPTEATPASPEVRVECPELANEERSAIEARQMSELLSQGGAVGTLLLVCSGDRVSGSWQEGGVVLDSRFLSRNVGEGAVELLHWVASVLLEMRREREAERESGRAEGAVAAAGTTAAVAAQPEEIQAPPPLEAEPAPDTRAQRADEPAAATAPPPAARAPYKAWTFGLAATYAHYGTEIAGTLGPRLTVSHVLAGSLHLTAAVDVKVGLGSSAGFGVLDVSAALGATFDINSFFSVTAAPLLVITTFSAPATTTGSTAPVVAGGFVASARARLPLDPLRPFVDLGLLAATPGRQVTLSGDPILTVPEWQALVSLGVELPL